MKKFLLSLSILLISINVITADNWREIHEIQGGAAINKAIFVRGFKHLIAVGDSGKVYRVRNGNLTETIQTPADTNELYDLYFENMGGNLVVVGENGTIMTSPDTAVNWTINTMGIENLNAIGISYATEAPHYFIGGENGTLLYADTLHHWHNITNLPVPSLSIKGFIEAADELFLYGIKNDTSYILKNQPRSNDFTIEDIIPNVIITDAFVSQSYMSQTIYLCGTDPSNTTSSIYFKDNPDGYAPLDTSYTGLPSGATSIDGYFDDSYYTTTLWVTIENGQIWKSETEGTSWNLVYNDNGKTLNNIIANPDAIAYGDYGFALGDNELFLKYAFGLDNVQPLQNEQFDSGLNHIELLFSAIPDTAGLLNSTILNSSLSGKLETEAAYHPGDSTIIDFTFTRNGNPDIIPGEALSFDIKGPIKEIDAQSSKIFTILRNYDVLSLKSSPIDYSANFLSGTLEEFTTNFVSGFFDDDDTLDAIAVYNSSILCYMGTDSGRFEMKSLGEFDIPNVDTSLSAQLIKYDIDNDGKLDLIYYTKYRIFLFKNTSSEGNITFLRTDASFHGSEEEIADIAVDNINHNGIPDLRVITNDRIYALQDITFSSIPAPTLTDYEYNNIILEMGDINGDGYNDAALANSHGYLHLYKGDSIHHLPAAGGDYSSNMNSSINDVKIANLNRNGYKEVIALTDHKIVIYDKHNDYWTFFTHEIIVNSDTLTKIVIQDFGGYTDGENALMDIAVITESGKLLIFENRGDLNFSADPVLTTTADFIPSGIIQGDFDHDKTINPLIFNRLNGQIQLFTKTEWRPFVRSAQLIDRDQISMDWTAYPYDNLDYYQVVRDTTSLFSTESKYYREFSIYGDTSFTDTSAHHYYDYFYAVRAVYNDESRSDLSDAMRVEKAYKLHGDLSGHLSAPDTIYKPYLVKDTIKVADNTTLTIDQGVTIAFAKDARFEISGSLTVSGRAFDEQTKSLHNPMYDDGMVNFISASPDEFWDGMFFNKTMGDTARFTGFNIQNCEHGIVAVEYPIKLKYGKFYKNIFGIYTAHNTIKTENVLFDSTFIPFILLDSCDVSINNTNVLNSLKYGLLANGKDLTLNVKNSIFWSNNDSSIFIDWNGDDIMNIFISYSTIDSIVGTQDTSHINRTMPPIFLPPENGVFAVDPMSPTVDAGDPNSNYSFEPIPNGGRINQGLWGNTEFAAATPLPDLFFEPFPVYLTAISQKADTAGISIINNSDNTVHINEVFLKDTTVHEFSFSGLSGSTSIPANDSVKFNIIFSPNKKGEYFDTLIVKTDSPTDANILLPIEGYAPNTPPATYPPFETLITMANDTLMHKIPVYDADGDTLRFFYDDEMPSWLTVTPQGVIVGTPSPSDTGYYEINIEIRDNDNARTNYYAEIMVLKKGQILSGAVSGVLNSLTSPYFVKDNIILAASDTLSIEKGTQLRFAPNTKFEVMGKLSINGDFDRMVEFMPLRRDSLWNGLNISSSYDSLKFRGLVIAGADTALKVESSNLFLSEFAVMHSNLGIFANNDSLYIKHAYIDSNNVGMIINSIKTNIRNITLLNSNTSGITISAGAIFNMRNAILWDNNNLSLISNVGSPYNCTLSYSTVDTIRGSYSSFEMNNNAPIFTHPQENEDGPPSLAAPSSPTIDAGDPHDDYSLEPMPNGGRINQGAFGGTFIATRSSGSSISFHPDTLKFSAFPNESDTLYLTVINSGASNLRISSVHTALAHSVFKVLTNAPYEISPADSIHIPVSFKAKARKDYLDTLIIRSNAPQKISHISLIGLGLNHTPIIVGTAPNEIRVEEQYRYKIHAFDKDKDSLRFTAIQLPSWLSLADSGIIIGTPSLADTGSNHVEVAIDDGYGGSVSFTEDIMVWIIDDYRPHTVIISGTRGIIHEAAAHFEFTADDTSGYLIGDPPEKLYKHYRLVSLNDQRVIFEADSIKDNSATLYPLDDGKYLFSIWAYDTHGNGINGMGNKQKAAFEIASSQVTMSRYRWHMVSFPRYQTFDLKRLNEDSTAIILRWSSTENDYLPPDNYQLSMGEAFWIQTNKAYNVDLSSYEHTSLDDTIYTSVEIGWNQIGIPLAYKVNWNEMSFIDSTGKHIPLIEALESEAVYWYLQNKQFQGYIWEKPDTALAYPWRGYWIKSARKGTLIFPKTPAVKSLLTKNTPSASQSALPKLSISDWQLNISLSNDEYIDNGNIIGVSPKIKKGLIYEPPHFREYCSLYFNNQKGHLTQNLKDNFENYEDVISWNFIVKSTNTGKQHLLKWNNEEINGLSLYIYLVDSESERIINMNDENSYSFTPVSSSRSFTVYATQDESFKPQIIPLEFKLLQNYPNPFNPRTSIRFGVPESLNGHKIRVTIFDILGRKIVTLLDEKMKPGYHEVSWNGANSSNVPSASGIYFYQIKGGSNVIVKKMILMR